MLPKIQESILPRQTALPVETRPLEVVDRWVVLVPAHSLNGTALRFLHEADCSPSICSLQLFTSFQPNIHLGLVFYNELHDITVYWDSLTPVERVISKQRFFLEYNDATAFPVLDAIYWIGGRSSQGGFPRPSPPTSRLLTLVDAGGRLQMSIVPDGERPTYYPHAPYTESVDHITISRLESELRTPPADMSPPTLQSLARAVCRALMVAGSSGTIRSPQTTNVLGDLIVMNKARAFWESAVELRHRFPMFFEEKSYKWTWHDNTTTGIYHSIPGWTRFTIGQNKGPWTTLSSIDIGDDGDNVDNWSVLHSALMNWTTTASADLRALCLERCTGNAQVGFVNRISIGTYIHGRYKPLPGFEAAETVYLFLENLRVGRDGYIAPCKRYWSLDRKGATPLSEGLKTLYGLDQSEGWDIRKGVKFFDSEQFAALDELRTRFGYGLKSTVPSAIPGIWKDVRSPLKRSQSVIRLQTVDWRTDWMWEEHHRIDARVNRKRQKWWLKDLRKRRPELFTPGSELEAELNKEEDEEPPKERDPVRRLHRSKTKSVGGGLSLIFSRIVL